MLTPSPWERMLAVIGGVVIAAIAVECLAGLLRVAVADRRADDHASREIGLDPAVGVGPVMSHDRRPAGAPSRFFTLERFSAAGDSAGGPAFRILALGGSTTDPVSGEKYAGRGNDWPRRLGATLAAAGTSVEVANAGMLGSLSAQELTRLIAILPDHRFDLVVSLTGINETYVADRDWYRDPDERLSPKFLLAALEDTSHGGTLAINGSRLGATSGRGFLGRLAIVQLIRDIGRWRASAGRGDGRAPSLEALATARPLSEERRRRLGQAADAWFAHVRMMDAVCREFGVRYAAVLQPALGVGVSRTDLVALLRDTTRRDEPDDALRRLLASSDALESLDHLYGLMRERARGFAWFHDLSGPDHLACDPACFHSPRYPNARGNERIADALATTVVAACLQSRSRLATRPAATASGAKP